MLELLEWDLSSHNWFHGMHGLSWWFILRYDGAVGCYGHLCCGILHNFLVNWMFKLSRWNVSGHKWFHGMHDMSWWFLLRHFESKCSDGCLCCWLLLGHLRELLLAMRGWLLSRLRRTSLVLNLRGRHFLVSRLICVLLLRPRHVRG